ncbi:MAG: hypothetical protein COV08_03650 [Candidatus Vogelbacteria bacterium CG10_big_fil_rev_8_21_14_0_10_49_38]|uniref:Uncharacterized protein n=1 Tax=Candidatus Vogelbacteria bacterium CG10_big_fil_rev_8_21_14_0_10_49_38 TaxID=1975043 RepID=A0A2H0RH23_9BACT|nr:MAG: hypothetical protein BK006_03640 [bacterium CG10_49_38]PIR45730.1 MAG: hypothetical protein COV08_03650 [Candidatus Vogelbacteria bacterium CG10_big_fil_rev_8_21_14_0_10_49_38]
MDFNQDQISDKLHSLPRKLREAIVDADLENLTENLRAKYGLHIDQLDRLIFEINLILVGLVPNSEFQSRIVKNVGVAEDVANLITYDLNHELFAKIRASLREERGQTNNGVSKSETGGDELEGRNESEGNVEKEIGRGGEEEGMATPKPSPDQTPKKMFNQKMSGLAGTSKQTVEVETKTGDNEEAKSAPIKARDPYREPI